MLILLTIATLFYILMLILLTIIYLFYLLMLILSAIIYLCTFKTAHYLYLTQLLTVIFFKQAQITWIAPHETKCLSYMLNFWIWWSIRNKWLWTLTCYLFDDNIFLFCSCYFLLLGIFDNANIFLLYKNII